MIFDGVDIKMFLGRSFDRLAHEEEGLLVVVDWAWILRGLMMLLSSLRE